MIGIWTCFWTWTEICSDSEVCSHDDAATNETMRNRRVPKAIQRRGGAQYILVNFPLTDETGDCDLDLDRDRDLDLDLDLGTRNRRLQVSIVKSGSS